MCLFAFGFTHLFAGLVVCKHNTHLGQEAVVHLQLNVFAAAMPYWGKCWRLPHPFLLLESACG